MNSKPCSPHNGGVFGMGQEVVAMQSQGPVRLGQNYRINAMPGGYVSLSEWRPVSNEFSVLPGVYDPSCFRAV